ncbi:HAD-like protein [Westerdykella ornata]|uniref:HAD-like protein n=1 Tax=Westerdykella ornata TaxID=318751 RepID=A0A6A6JD67_WESOR|nr:HAD-like protein [Westerdykella ornata]KAF2274501.1 HAD-like protein [Westerdykella ornata]
MSKLTDFRLLSFDVYGTLIDWETGLVNALQPVLDRNGISNLDKETILRTCQEVESVQQQKTPGMIYSDVLTTIHPELVKRLGCGPPTPEESKAFGDSVGVWPAFPDTLPGLQRLAKHYKLVLLSNVDNISFHGTHTGPLRNFPFDAVLTAQDIGCYKPDHRTFEYMLKYVKEKFGVEKEQVLQTAQSQFHDQQPCRELGIKGAWIARYGAAYGHVDEPVYDWKFATLEKMAEAVEREAVAK